LPKHHVALLTFTSHFITFQNNTARSNIKNTVRKSHQGRNDRLAMEYTFAIRHAHNSLQERSGLEDALVLSLDCLEHFKPQLKIPLSCC